MLKQCLVAPCSLLLLLGNQEIWVVSQKNNAGHPRFLNFIAVDSLQFFLEHNLDFLSFKAEHVIPVHKQSKIKPPWESFLGYEEQYPWKVHLLHLPENNNKTMLMFSDPEWTRKDYRTAWIKNNINEGVCNEMMLWRQNDMKNSITNNKNIKRDLTCKSPW